MHGHYATDLLPSFILVGLGMGISFVAVTIAALAGVPGRDAGIASGLVNTSRQIGGAIGLAAVTTIATSAAGGHRLAGTTHGYRVAFRNARRARPGRCSPDTHDARRASSETVTAEVPVDAGLAVIEEAA